MRGSQGKNLRPLPTTMWMDLEVDLLAPAEPLDNYSPSRQLDSNLMKSFELEPHRCFCCSVAQSCPTLCNPMDCSTPGLPVLHHLPELAQTHVHSVTDANHLILCRPHLLLPSIFPSIRVFYNELALCNRWPKYWSFSFCISPSNEYSGLISFRIDWFDLSAVQGTLKSLLQYHSLKASVLWCSAFLIVQL